MIINPERNPTLSLYYLGSIVLKILLENNSMAIEELYRSVQLELDKELHIDFFYYTLDWLYILSAVKIEEDRICLCA